MPDDHREEWSLSLFVPDPNGHEERLPDPAVERHSMLRRFFSAGRVERVDGEAVRSQWAGTIETLMKLSSSVSESLDQWQIDQMEVGLTLSAKGELLFIAEAGAEASIKLILKKKP